MPAYSHTNTEVAIVGAGPVGTLLAILLGRQGHSVTLIERWPEVYELPRAVTMDHEVARIFATLGIDSNDDPLIAYFDELYYWRNSAEEDLQIVDWRSVSPSGWRVTYWFNQPNLERRLHEIAATISSINLQRGWELTALQQRADQVKLSVQQTAELFGADAQQQTISAQYVIGCDGANSFVREALQIPVVDRGYFFDWLILDMIPPADHVVSPAQWQLCDPARPTTIVPGGPGRRRWEFMVLPGESTVDIATAQSAWRLLEPWGLTPDNATLERSAVYRFQARWAEQWRVGRCLIAGDAAHLMPPFAGEGMCAGLRDAVALGWRLAGVLNGSLPESILDSYVTERIHHARHYIDFSQQLGEIICITDAAQAAQRDRRMKAELAARDHSPLNPDHVSLGPGIWCEGTVQAGELSPQGVVRYQNVVDRFDQAVGRGWLLVGYECDPRDGLSEHQLVRLEQLGAQTLSIGAPGAGWQIEDCDGSYQRWLSSIDAYGFILRPDFYLAATISSGDNFANRVDQLLALIDQQPRGEC